MITPLDSRVMDANAEALGVGVKTLMGNAGKAVAGYILKNHSGKRIAFFCGHGNNGGDGYAAAALLEGEHVKIYAIGGTEKIRSPVVREYAKLCENLTEPYVGTDLDFDVLVDCGLGTGLNGNPKPEYAEYIRKVNSFGGTVVSVDVPTGFGTETSIRPTVTIAMHDVKEGMTEDNCGKIIVADISMPPEAYTHTGPGDVLRYPVPEKESHKGSNGSLLIIGGGPYFGAPAMAAMAALRVGTDLVTVAAPESVYHEIASASPVLMISKLKGDCLCPEHLPSLLELGERNDAVLIGPGLGKDPQTAATVRKFVAEYTKPMVIDADGLNALGNDFAFGSRNIVLTPHSKEYERLGGTPKSYESVRNFAKTHGCTVLLKGPTDIVSDGNRIRFNSTGCPAMTGAGTGDVLSGIVAGLLSKKMDTFDAACLGAYISGKAGESAFGDYSYGLIATDIIDRIPGILPRRKKRTVFT